MRKLLTVTAVLGCSLAVVGTSKGQTSTGQFFGGFTPQNLTMTPVSWNSTMTPTNLSQAMTPQTQSSKVFDIGSAFHSVTLPLFQSHTPTTPIVKPGTRNPLQPINQQVKSH